MHSCWRWSKAVGGFLGSPREMWSTTLTLLACRLDGKKLVAAKKEFLQMEKDGIV
jgi:hypothetical protein